MKKPRNPKRTLVLRLRRLVKVSHRFDVRQVGPLREEQTCRTCGHKEFHEYPVGSSTVVVAKLIRYRSANGGVSGVCPSCSKSLAKERYPLPEDTARTP